MSHATASAAVELATRAADPQRQETARGAQRRGCGLGSTAMEMVIEMAELTIGDMIERVPRGHFQLFPRTTTDPTDERYCQVRQSWDYDPVRLEWKNRPGILAAPWAGTRKKPRTPLTKVAPPEVVFAGPAQDVVDFYDGAVHAFLISDRLFQLIERIDPGSLESVEFRLRANDAEIPFHAVMPKRVVEAIDTRRTTVLIKDDDAGGGVYFRRVRFPEGIVFDHEALRGAASFSDFDAPGWYWSMDLLEQAQARGIRGLYAQSVASSPAREIARL